MQLEIDEVVPPGGIADGARDMREAAAEPADEMPAL